MLPLPETFIGGGIMDSVPKVGDGLSRRGGISEQIWAGSSIGEEFVVGHFTASEYLLIFPLLFKHLGSARHYRSLNIYNER